MPPLSPITIGLTQLFLITLFPTLHSLPPMCFSPHFYFVFGFFSPFSEICSSFVVPLVGIGLCWTQLSLRVRHMVRDLPFARRHFLQLGGNDGSRKVVEEHPELPDRFSGEFLQVFCTLPGQICSLSIPSNILLYSLSQIGQHRTFLHIISVHITQGCPLLPFSLFS